MTISNSTFLWNAVDGTGGAVYLTSSNILISNATFLNNSASIGGALALAGSQASTITDCVFSGNNATNDGGAVSIRNSKGALIARAQFFFNLGSFGGAVAAQSAIVTISSSVLSSNFASLYGGSVSARLGANVSIENTSVTDNSASVGAGAWSDHSTFVVRQSSFLRNASPGGGGAILVQAHSLLDLDDATMQDNTLDAITCDTSTVNAASLFETSEFKNNTRWNFFCSKGSCTPCYGTECRHI